MSDSFLSEYFPKVDAKARMLIPAEFRRILDAGCTATPENPRTRFTIIWGLRKPQCDCYSAAEMERLAARIRRVKQGTPERERLEREMLKRACRVDIDDDGRIVLPQAIRDKMGLTPEMIREGVEVVLAGAGDRFELWRADVYRAANAMVDEAEDDGVNTYALLPDEDPGL
jgi:MraZ protein